MRRPKRHLTVAAACAVFAIVLFAGIAAAQTFGDKLRSGDTVTVPAGETVAHDLYIFAGATRIEGTVDGDLVATGGAIDVTGTVTGDVLAAGGTVTINGTVGGDARIAGGTLSVGGAVTEDLAAAGGQVSVDPSATIGEDMLASAGRLAMDGSVTGDLTATTGTYEKTGTVGGAEDVRLTPTRADTTPAPAQTVAGTVLDAIQHFLVVVFVGAILVWLAPRAYASVTETIQRRPLPAAGWGVIGLIGYIVALLVIAVAMIVLAIIFGIVRFDDLVGLDVLGGIVAMLGLTLGFVVVCAYVADAVVGAAAAGLLMRSGSPTRTRELGLLAIGAAGVVVLSVLPVVGPLIKLVVVVLGLGAILMLMWNARQTPTVEHPIAIPPTG